MTESEFVKLFVISYLGARYYGILDPPGVGNIRKVIEDAHKTWRIMAEVGINEMFEP